ncbi:MAG TPA: hypothetical protein VKU40_15450 [Thermoanaerobaculia bacterium]|nr:hypothetical protein [Thermoanaerobaculia bacterium]
MSEVDSHLTPARPPRPPLPVPPGAVETRGGVWRLGPVLVAERSARLPRWCLHCGRPTGRVLRRTLSWNPRMLLVSLLPSTLVSLAGSLFARRTAFELPLCRRHVWWGRARFALGLLLCVAGFVAVFQAMVAASWPAAALAAGLFAVGIFLLAWNSAPVVTVKIDEHHVWLGGISPLYLERLPPVPTWVPPP